MRLIDADELEKKKYSYFSHETAKYRQVVFMGDVDHMPTIDAVPVVRCKDCKHSRGLNEKERLCVCDNALICKNSEAHVDGWNPMWPDDFCSYGEKRCDDAV